MQGNNIKTQVREGGAHEASDKDRKAYHAEVKKDREDKKKREEEQKKKKLQTEQPGQKPGETSEKGGDK